MLCLTQVIIAFQYYMYELLDEGKKVEPCPRHVCPFAMVAFSYGKTSISLEPMEKRSASLVLLFK